MHTSIIKYKIFIIGLFLIFSCDRNDPDEVIDCIEEDKYLVIRDTEAPSSARVGQTIQINLKIVLSNSCETFQEITDSRNGDITYINATGIYDGCNPCTQAESVVEKIYEFTPQSKGTYSFIFNTEIKSEQFSFSISIN
ncbi:hypothetical protein OO013_04220 [Mangrovivirga sp. M17]|uniref:DUF4625 domain-containing protein n=1 Tax=Mangrovivirga halotolerans TaxID=2993936 RepID=A0ABT3RN80_9BACT|nr:hypothetical protein [Mangrovivirga halotolerans]MCX2743055.1 hypothetical protein [Mangrovivirga halotolerans]